MLLHKWLIQRFFMYYRFDNAFKHHNKKAQYLIQCTVGILTGCKSYKGIHCHIHTALRIQPTARILKLFLFHSEL